MTIQKMSYAEAVLTALNDSMIADDSVSLIGRPFSLGPTRVLAKKLKEKFPTRVCEPPTSEAANAAVGAGAAMAGARPFVDLGTGAFSFLAFSQIVNEAAVCNYMSGGKLRAPVVYHVNHGVRGAGAPQHSHDMHAYVWNTPGLQVILPATPNDAYGLVRSALTNPNPTFIMSHFKQATMMGDVELGVSIPFGKADVKRTGTDVTIIAVSLMVHAALEAAEQLATRGISAEVVDVRSLSPLDEDTLLESIAKTGRVIVVDESPLHGGVSSGIAGVLADRGFKYLKAPIRRVGRPNTPVPASGPMEEYLVPGPQHILEAVASIL